MESLAGKELQHSGAVHAYQLDGKGGVTPIGEQDVANSEKPCWLHLDSTLPASVRWLNKTTRVPDSVRNALAGESARPRVTRLGEGTLITLRSINLNANARPDQLVAVRVFITDKLIISTRRRKILAIDEILTDLKEGNGPTDSGSWLVSIAESLTDHTSEFIDDLHEKIIDLEEDLLEQKIPPRGGLALIRKQLIVLRRYMTPQRDVFSRISGERLPWMQDDDRRRMQEIADRLGRGLEDLDASIARTTVLSDEITALMTEAMNRRTYTMSLLAMVFLPTTFLTGLFGVNLGGIPGGDAPFGFFTFCLMLVILVGGVAWWLKRSKWL
ncbi:MULTISPECIES: zinc transporter ZntB [Pectobacterium]|uniref:Zinc transport protein ZntB n=2 Tax=Pectobacterium TaxID=122277 RepID=A0AA93AME6_9GAMM|nr:MULTISPECIES: zinc transporter ZntB [Pectobacterium]PLY39135.1 zinc transporter ZntB [Pectobacterium carotovorum]MBE5202340.1 zinc transporter ZntB [Pectobacterium quasiaquaticum]MBE5208581.1 zinc transporter ZntB [Pectobacterium quasiaquaticum]MBE5214197.1 zinc transporter ZntB [Pectobacterium quasiaquaticum]MBE5219926.1 zinc transporter ZntB [Pectobacterium quasiaquaticum]